MQDPVKYGMEYYEDTWNGMAYHTIYAALKQVALAADIGMTNAKVPGAIVRAKRDILFLLLRVQEAMITY